MRAIWLLVLVFSHPTHAVEVANFRSGLACTNTSPAEGRKGWICHPTEEVLITDQGRCKFNGQDRLCTWMGFEFDYSGAGNGTALTCFTAQSEPSDFGNPEEHLLKGATEQEFSLPLAAGSGHFYNPQFFTFGVREPGNTTVQVWGHCSHEGSELFRWRYLIRFPERPALQPTPNNSSKPTPLRGAA